MEWFLACSVEDSTLVGVQEATWRCPVLGLVAQPVTTEQLCQLEEEGERVSGSADMQGIFKVSDALWLKIFGEDLSDEWDHGVPYWVVIETDAEYVIRLHLAFE